MIISESGILTRPKSRKNYSNRISSDSEFAENPSMKLLMKLYIGSLFLLYRLKILFVKFALIERLKNYHNGHE